MIYTITNIVSSSWNIAVIVLTCLFGDYLTFTMLKDQHSVLKALSDNLTHGWIALFSWYYIEKSLKNSIICGLLAMLVDLDHFIEAKSFQLHQALNLTSRPFMHNSTFPIFGFIFVLFLNHSLIAVGDNNKQFVIHNHVKTVSCLVFVAIFSHHLRDANRRGLWFSPVGSTPPIPYLIYILSIILLCVSIKYYLLMNSNIFSLPR